jgi:hypothetical protein
MIDLDPAPDTMVPDSHTAGGEGASPQAADLLRSRLFGVALFFSGLEILFEGQPLMLETHRRQCRNLIQRGYAALDLIERSPSAGVADLAGEGAEAGENRLLLERADILVQTYDQLFPGRNRLEPLSRDETLALMEAAALRGAPGIPPAA